MAWIYLVIAGMLEVVWAFSMKQSAGFTRLVPTIITFVFMTASFVLLSISMRSLPLGTAYTVWTGIGAIGAFAVGIMVLGESASPMRVAAAALIIIGLVLRKLSSNSCKHQTSHYLPRRIEPSRKRHLSITPVYRQVPPCPRAFPHTSVASHPVKIICHV